LDKFDANLFQSSLVFATNHKGVPSFLSLEDANTLMAPPSTAVDLLLLGPEDRPTTVEGTFRESFKGEKAA